MSSTKNLGFVKAIQSGSTPPSNTKMVWWDTNENLHKAYNTETNSWVPLRNLDPEDFVQKSGSVMTGELELPTIQFDTEQDYTTELGEGQSRWNNHDQTIEYGTADGRKVQVNQEIGLPVRNTTGGTLLNGRFVRIAGYNGGYYTIEYSDNRTKEASHVDFMLSEDVDDDGVTVPTKIGLVRGINTTGCTENATVYLGEDGQWTCIEPMSPRYKRPVGHIGKVGVDGEIYVSITSQEQGDIQEQLLAANMPHGIPVDQKPNILLQYNPANRELMCSGSFYYFMNTEKIIADDISETIVHDDTSGTYFYILSKDGLGRPLLIVKNTFFTLGTDIPLAFVIYNNSGASTFWSGVNGKLFCERHGCEMDKATHFELHNNLGCYATSGFALAGYQQATGTGSLADNTFSIDSGKIYDEDNHTLIPTLPDNNGVGANYNVWYKLGTDWLWYESNLPYLLNTEVQINTIAAGLGSLTALTGNSFMNMWIIGMPELDKTTGQPTNSGFGLIVGQQQYTTLALATGASFFDVDLSEFPSAEVAPLWQITFRRESSYEASVGRVRIESVRRIVGTRFASGTTATSLSIHNNTTGRDADNCHPISAITDLQTTLDTKVVGSASSTDNAIARFDGTTGKLVQNSGAYIDDSGRVGIGTTTPSEVLDVVGNIAVSGTVDGRDVSADGLKLDNIVNSKGQINGYASLDGSGKVPSSQLPSYVDDVIEGYFNTVDSKFYVEDTYVTEILGETGKIYVSLDTKKLYRWSGITFINITSGAVDSVNDETGLVDLKQYKCDSLVTLTNLLANKTGNILIELTKNIDLTTTNLIINELLENVWIKNYDFLFPAGGCQIIFSATNNCNISIVSNLILNGFGSVNIQLNAPNFELNLKLKNFSAYVSSFTKTENTTGNVEIESWSGYSSPNGVDLDNFVLNSTWLNPSIEKKLLNSSEFSTSIDNSSKFFFSFLGLKQITWTNIKTILNSLYQSVLVSGTNIKTINSESILGAGNINIPKPTGLENSLLTANSSGEFISSGIYKVSTINEINSAIVHAISTGNTKILLNITELADNKTGTITIPTEAENTLFIFLSGSLGRWGNITFVNNSPTNHEFRFLDIIELTPIGGITWTTASNVNVFLSGVNSSITQNFTRAGVSALFYESKSDNVSLLGGSWIRTKWKNLFIKDDALGVSNNLSDVSDKQIALNNLTQVSGATNEYVLTKDTLSGNAIWKEAQGGNCIQFALPEDLNNSAAYFYSYGKFTSGIDNIRSGGSTGFADPNQVMPILASCKGRVLKATCVLRGAAVWNGTVTYPCTFRCELWKVGFSTEGTKLGDIDFSISDAYTVGTYNTSVTTNFQGTTMLNILVEDGDMLALKWVPLTSPADSGIAGMKNAIVTLTLI